MGSVGGLARLVSGDGRSGLCSASGWSCSPLAFSPAGQADRRPGERRGVLAARGRRVHPGAARHRRRSSRATRSRPSSSTSGRAASPPADLAAVTDQVSAVQRRRAASSATSVGPIPSQDQQALQVIVPIDAGSGGWDSLGTTVDDHARHRRRHARRACRCTSPARSASPPTRRRRSPASTASCSTARWPS